MVALADTFRDPAAVTPETHTPVILVYVSGLRYYSPGLGRWINRDSIGEMSRPELFLAVGSLRAHGLYAFVQNDPLNTVDLLGLVPRIRWE